MKPKIAIIGGTVLNEIYRLDKYNLNNISTPYGKAAYFLFDDLPILFRHGENRTIPPHKINHKANIFGLKKIKTRYIISFNSVGSLKKEIKPGEFLVPDDYINFYPVTFYDKTVRHITPSFSCGLKNVLITIFKKLGIRLKVGGVYFQVRGPRLETKAEIGMIKNFADVVGMTMASEATLSREMDMEYISLCLVDNFANGITKNPLAQEEIENNQRKNKEIVKKIIKEISICARKKQILIKD